MSVLWSTPELAARFSKYVEELRDYLVSCCMHYGSADDLAAVATRLDSDEAFRDDFASLLRATILREGGVVPRANLLEIVAIALGGADFDQAGNAVQQPIHQLFSFISGVTAKPWNQPPGEDRLKPEAIPATVYEMPPPSENEESAVAAPQTSAAAHGKSPAESYEAMLATRHQVVPISTHRPPENRPNAATANRAEWLIASGGTISPPASKSEGMFTRLNRVNHVERQAEARSVLSTASIPGPAPTPIPPPPPPPPVTTAPGSAFEASHAPAQHDAPDLHHAPGATASDPVPAAARIQDTELHRRTVFLSTSGPEPPTLPELAELSAPRSSETNSFFPTISFLKLPPLSLPKFSVPKIPRFSLPKLSVPKVSLPKLPKFSRSSMALSKFSPFRMSPALIFGAALAGACVAVFATARVLSHSHSQSQAAARRLSVATPVATAPAPVATAAAPANPAVVTPADTVAVAPLSTPTATERAKPSAYGSRRDDYIAKPYSRPIPGRSGIPASAPAASSSSGEPSGGPVHASDLRPASFSGPATAAHPGRPIDPDATYVGASAAERAADAATLPPPRRYHTVSAGVMKNNLISAPAPGYPLLAKMTHIQGDVVVQAIVARDGTVSDAHVVRGHHLLRGAAVDAVRRWRYRPFTIDGRAVEVATTITLSFPAH